jgi:hypothetical protein
VFTARYNLNLEIKFGLILVLNGLTHRPPSRIDLCLTESKEIAFPGPQ